MSAHDKYLRIAVINGAFGIKGEVKIKAFTDELEACLSYGPLTDARGKVILTPTSSRAVKNAMAAYCEEVKTREEAEALKGVELYVLRSALPETDEDDFYYTDLIGLQVKTVSGQNAGTIIAMHEFGSNDMMEIKPPKKADSQATWYHPFTKISVPIIDIARGRVVIDPLDVVNADPELDDDDDSGSEAEPEGDA